MIRRLLSLAVAVLIAAPLAHAQVAGDTNCDGVVDLRDPEAFLGAIFTPPPDECVVEDVNFDLTATAADVISAIRATRGTTNAGPAVTFFGLVGASGTPLSPIGYRGRTPVYFRNSGSGFRIVLEVGLGSNGVSPGEDPYTYDPLDHSLRPDLQVACTKDLGDGSPEVCSTGVPAIRPPHLAPDDWVSDAINDLGCHFDSFTAAAFGCTVNQFGNPSFLNSKTRLQYCALANRDLEFPQGETLCSARVRDRGGEFGPVALLAVQVAPGPVPPTFTPTSAFPTATRPVSTATPSRTATRAPTFTPTWSATPFPTSSPTAALTATPTPISTPTEIRSPSATPSLSPTRTITPTPTKTSPPTATFTPTRTRTPSLTATVTRTATAPPPQGPVITFFGLARADDTRVQPIGTTDDGTPIYAAAASGFRIVIEAKRGASRQRVGLITSACDPNDPGPCATATLPDLQILASRNLGNGSAEVCDGKTFGGVPATNPPVFSSSATAAAKINDLGCRFQDGAGLTRGRDNKDDSCVADAGGIFGFVDPTTTVQFCASVDRSYCFPNGDTRLVVRVRDEAENVGAPAQILIRSTQACP